MYRLSVSAAVWWFGNSLIVL